MIVRLVACFSLVAVFLTGCFNPVVEKRLPNPKISRTGGANYKLAPNDKVVIRVFQEVDMTTEQQISRDGSVSIPLIGQVIIGGLTKGEAETLIAKKLGEKYLIDPQVSLSIIDYGVQEYTILGQVNAPGAYPVPLESPVFTLPMAIAIARGNTRIGNLRNIKITRYSKDAISLFTVNMLSTEGQQFLIQPGDLITVQETLF